MFVDFNNVFIQSNNKYQKCPPALIKYLNSKLPKGLTYVESEDGYYHIISDGIPISIGGLSLFLNDEQKKVIGDEINAEKIFKYSYNSQKPIKLEPKEKGFIVLNEKKINIDMLSFFYKDLFTENENELFLIPAKFPGKFTITLSGNGRQKDLTISRVPNESVFVSKYESADDDVFKIVYYIDESNNSLSLNINPFFYNAKTVRDLLDCYNIFSAFINGKGYIGKELFCQLRHKNDNIGALIDKKIIFWEKVYKIEQKLGVSFKLPHEDISLKTAYEIELLYQNLICNNPIRHNSKINYIEGKQNKEIEESIVICKSYMFQYDGTLELDIFDVKISIPCFFCVFNIKVKDFAVNEEDFRIYLEDSEPDNPMFCSLLCFKDEEEYTIFKNKNNFNKIVSLFKNAKSEKEYLN